MKVNSIIVRGLNQTDTFTAAASDDLLELKSSIIVGGGVRGVAESHQIDLTADDVIEVVLDDTTTWYCSPDSLDEIFSEAEMQNRSAAGAFEVPAFIRSGSGERGLFGNLAIKLLNVFTKKKVVHKVADLAADLERKQLDNLSGLYHLDKDFNFHKYEAAVSDKPYFIFLHGTASSTFKSFGELIGTDTWKYIHETYGDNVLAFQHESLTKSPLLNALQLVQALPARATLHLMSQSRGGLIGDILCRFCTTNDNNRGFTEPDIARLRKEGNRNHDLQMIEALKMEFSNKRILVEKFIRSASPSDGTNLAGRRADFVLNMIFNLIGVGVGLAGSPVYLAFRGLIANVVDAKNDVNVLPGLEAQNPKSPFIVVLNRMAEDVMVDTPLTVMSGNCKARFNLRGLLIIASKLFNLEKNDLVIDTDSMYKTPRRSGLVQFYFDEGTDVDHFSYFKNDRTRRAFKRALEAKPNTPVEGFQSLTQVRALEAQRNAALGLEGGRVFRKNISGNRPIAIVLPGIMGSNLMQDETLIWINYWGFVTGQLTRLNIKGKNISADSLISTSYLDLVNSLEKQYDVITFAFDWRLQLNQSAALFNDKIAELLKFRQPIKIVAHSMGGVLVRDFIVNYPDTWQQLNKSAAFKLLFLGAPLGGSFRIPSVLFGEDAIIDKLNKIDIWHSKKELLDTFARLPGILSLLPLTTDADNDFASAATWNKMKAAFGKDDWPIPNDKDLQEFGKYRDYINSQMEGIDYTNMVYIAGKDKATPSAYRIDKTAKGEELVFLSTGEGDQSVTWDSGIPKKMIDSNAVYYVNVTHGGLSCDKSMFRGIDDILANGFTNLMSKNRPVVRGEEKVFRMPNLYDFDLTERGLVNSLMGKAEAEEMVVTEAPVQVIVSQSDLRYSSFPLLAGHFAGDGILYAEKAINTNLKGALTQRHQLGLYPGKIGTSEIVITNDSGFKGALIVGLGEMNKLTAFQLSQTVEQGMSRYLLDLNTRGPQGVSPAQKLKQIGISSLAIGCGYGGLTVEESVKAIIRGIANANAKVGKLYEGDARLIEYIEFVEQYEDKALSTYRAVRKIEAESDRLVNIVLAERKVQVKRGFIQRIAADSSSDWWTRISVQLKEEIVEGLPLRSLQFTVSTDGSRQEQRFLLTTRQIIEQLVDEISEKNSWTAPRAKAIFELLIPNDFKELLKKQGNILWILDKTTAAYPWELLQDSVANVKPLCVNGGMVRQLATEDYNTRITAVTTNKALVIGDPNLNGFLPQLPGAREEGMRVQAQLTNNGYDVVSLLNGSSAESIIAMFSNEYKIIHLAGHGVFNEDPSKGSGMVIGNNTFLSTREVGQMSAAPDLVFVNCCYLGKTDGVTETFFRRRYKLAANIGTQLIDNGVKAVIVAGWAVDDSAALEFTELFYKHMFAGSSFGMAVREARKVVFEKYGHTNTWGAYQCYGDPFYRLVTTNGYYEDNVYSFAVAEEAVVKLANLANSIEGGGADVEAVKAYMKKIAQAVDEAGLRNAEITEKEAQIYAELLEYEAAIEKYQALVNMENASFSVAAMERYSRVRIEKCMYDSTQQTVKHSLLLAVMKDVIDDVTGLLRLGATVERYLLLGHATRYKAVLLDGKTERTKEQKIKLYQEAAFYFQKAYALRNSPAADSAITPWLETEQLLFLLADRKWGELVKWDKETYQLLALDAAATALQNRKTALENVQDYKRFNFFNVTLADVDLCHYGLIATSSQGSDAFLRLQETYATCWLQNGIKSNTFIILPHINFLIDALLLSNKRNAVAMRKQLTEMRDKLLTL